MILVVGGIASGKRTYVQSLGYSDAQVVYGLENTLRKGSLSQNELQRLMQKEVVVCCEVGQGVVPIDAREREWRERVGRTCCTLAQHACKVVRMVCGIPVILKDVDS